MRDPEAVEICEEGSPAYFGTGAEWHVLSWRERRNPHGRAAALRRRAERLRAKADALADRASSLEAGIVARKTAGPA